MRARINVGPPFGNISAQQNIPKSRIKGAEFSVTFRPVPGLSLVGSGTYLDSEIREYTGFTVDSELVNFAGAPINFTPKWSFNGDVNYRTTLTATLSGFAGVNVAYRGKTTAVFVNPGNPRLDVFNIDKYTLVDGQLGVEGDNGRWKMFVWGKNIFNKYYWTNAVRVSTVNIRYPGMPATYGITASYRY